MNVSKQVRPLHRLFADGTFSLDCPSRVLLDHVFSKWGVLVLVALSDGSLRWSELRRTVAGISEKMLAQTLRLLERDGLVHRDAHPVIPPHVDYSLTASGTDLVELMMPLMTWVEAHAGVGHAGRGPGDAGLTRADAAIRHGSGWGT